MNPIKTWLLVALAVLVFVFIVFYEGSAQRRNQFTETQGRLFPDFNPATAASVEVISRTNQIIRAERTNEEWRLVLPVNYPAHATRIEHLLSAFGQLNRQSHISAQELIAQKQPLAAFGLDPPRASVAVQYPPNHFELKVGGLTPVGNQVYVQLVGVDGVFFTDAALIERMPQCVDDWRNHTFLPLKDLAFNRLEARTGNGGFVVQIDPTTQLWRLTYPTAARADNLKLNALIHRLKSWQVSQFVPDNPKPDQEALGLQPPEVVLAFGQGSNDVLVVPFGKSPTNDPTHVYASPPTSPIVLVERKLLDQLRVPWVELREPRLISAPLHETGLIEIQAEEKFTLQRQNDGSWRVVAPVSFPADRELVQLLLSQLSALTIVKFEKDVVTDFTTYGLVNPSRRFILKTGLTNTVAGMTNRLLAQLDFGNTNQTDKIYARLGSEDSLYSTSLAAILRLPSQAFQMRERRLWNFDATNVSQVVIALKGQTRKLVRNASGSWTLAPNPTPLVSPLNAAVEETLHRLGELRSEFWVARGEDKLARLGFPEAAHSLALTITIGTQPQTLTLDFGGEVPSRNVLASTVVEGQRLVFEMKLATFELYQHVVREVNQFPPEASR